MKCTLGAEALDLQAAGRGHDRVVCQRGGGGRDDDDEALLRAA